MQQRRLHGRSAPLLALLTLLLAAPVLGEPIPVSISGNTIRASDVSRGGEVIFFACTIGRYSGMQKLGRHLEMVPDADGDGEVSLTVENLADLASVWAVVDFETGRYALAAPPGLPLRAMNVPEHGWRGGREHFELRRNYLEVLVVRPGAGAWTQSLTEGGPDDDDGQLNTIVRTKLARMQRLHGDETAPRPPVILPHDLLLVIDPHELDYFVAEAP